MKRQVNRNQDGVICGLNHNPLSIRRRIDMALRKIEREFPNMPEGKLMFAVVRRAIEDLNPEYENEPRRHIVNQRQMNQAARYLRGNGFHAELAGVNPRWIYDIVESLDLLKLITGSKIR